MLQANMHAAFSYDRRDPYARLPLESHVSSANDPSTTSITSVNNVNDHVSPIFHEFTIIISDLSSCTHPVKIDLNKKLDLKQKTIQGFNIDA